MKLLNWASETTETWQWKHPQLVNFCMETDAIKSNVSNMTNNILPQHLVKIRLQALKKYTKQLTAKSLSNKVSM